MSQNDFVKQSLQQIQYVLILGTHFRVSRAEAVSVIKHYEGTIISSSDSSSTLIFSVNHQNTAQQIFSRLGGSIQLEQIIDQVDPTDLERLKEKLFKYFVHVFANMSESKLKISLSFKGEFVKQENWWKLKKELRYRLKQEGKKISFVGRFKDAVLSSATVFHLLETGKGIALELISIEQKHFLTKIIKVQDLNFWRKIDMELPELDLRRVGALPPKLACIMVNLAKCQSGDMIWDPFCGNGIILLQSLLKKLNVLGSDKSKMNVEITQRNMEWLWGKYPSLNKYVGYAFKHDVNSDPYLGKLLRDVGKGDKFGAIITEPYLGPLTQSKRWSRQHASEIWQKVLPLYQSLLKHGYKMLRDEGYLVVIKPIFKVIKSSYRGHDIFMWYNPQVPYNKNRWRLLGDDKRDLVWRSNVKLVKRQILVFQKTRRL